MTLTGTFSRLEKFATDNSPHILTGVGVVGSVSTAVLAARAGMKYQQLMGPNPHLTAKERLEVSWKLWIPPVTTGVLTVGSIICANRIGTRRAAVMAAAYMASERTFDEYREKVKEKLGERKEEQVRSAVAQDQLNRNPSAQQHVFSATGGDVLCYEPFTGRYFTSDMESIKKAQNNTNYQVLNNYYASLTDLYDHLGLDRTSMSDELGWNSDELLEIEFTTGMSDDQRPCLVMNYKVVPIRGYSRVQ